MASAEDRSLSRRATPGNGSSLISGRDRELASLDKAFAAAARGRGRTILIKGEPGIGKTTLAEAFSEKVTSAGANVLWGRAWEAGGAPAYWPWIQVLRGAISIPDEQEIQRVRPYLDVVAALVPEVAGPGGVQRPQTEVGEQQRFVLFDAVSRVLQACASAAPLVIVLDDFHAVEDSSLLLLRFLARDIRTSRCLIVVTHRDQEVEVDPRAKAILAEVARDGEVMGLSGLDADAIAAVLTGAAGAPPSEALKNSLHQITEGNPFYANEIMKLLVEEGQIEARLDLARRALPVPDSVSALVLRRLNNLDPQLRKILSAASVIGREFRADVLACVVNVEATHLEVSLELSEAEGLTRSTEAGVHLFDHNLIREALYESLSEEDRSRLHGAVASALEEIRPSNEDQNLSEIAHHYLRASLDDVRPSFEYALRAGAKAMEVYAFEQAISFFEEALGLSPVAASTELERGQVLLDLGEALLRAGRVVESSERLQAAAEIARSEGSAELTVQAAVAHCQHPSEGGIVNPTTIRLIEDALEKLPAEDSYEKALMMVRLAAELWQGGNKADGPRKDQLAYDGIAMARRVAHPRELAQILRFAFTAIFAPDRLEESMAIADEITQLGISQRDKVTLLTGRLRRAAILMSMGAINETEAEFKEAAELAEKLRQPIFASPTAFLKSALTMIKSDIPTALKQADKALAVGPEVPNALGAHLLQHVTLRLETDGGADFEPFVRAVIEQRPGLRRAWGSGLIQILAKTGRVSEARALLRDAIEDLPDSPMNISYVTTVHFAVEGVRILREPYGCELLYEALLPFRAQHFTQMMLAPVAYYGSVERDLGTLAALMERWEIAEDHFERALREHARVGARIFLAWTQTEYAEMLCRRGRPEDAPRVVELLDESMRTAEELGLHILKNFAAPLLSQDGVQKAATSTKETASIVKEGEYVTITWGQEIVHLRHTKGVTYLARLLANPGREIHVLEVASEGAADPKVDASELGLASDDLGAALDPQAKAAYKRRIHDLREDIEEAGRFNDPGRAERAQEELEFITREIAGAVGLGGRDRKTASNAERARVNVTKRLKETIGKIGAGAPRLGKHLSTSVKTGTFLSYGEDETDLPMWDIDTVQLR